MVVPMVLALVAASDALLGPASLARPVALWATCVVVLVDRARLQAQRAALESPDSGGGRLASWGRRVALPALALGVLVVPIGARAWRPELVLAPACVALLAAWHYARRLLYDARASAADDLEAHSASAIESLLFRGAVLAACGGAVVVAGDALWRAEARWQRLRDLLPWAMVLAVLWVLYGGLRGAPTEVARAALGASRDWAASDDATRDRAWSTGAVLDALDLTPGLQVADVGAGGGYYALKVAERVGPEGKVFATDDAYVAVARLREAAQRRGFGNLQALLVDGVRPLPVTTLLDRILLANVYLFSTGAERAARDLIEEFAAVLRPGGRLVVYCEFVHEAGWSSSPQWPPLDASQPDGRTLGEWASPWFDLAAQVPLPTPKRPFEPHESIGYLIVLKRRAGAAASRAGAWRALWRKIV